MTETTFDFHDGNGPVKAHKHTNGGGWVADTAQVSGNAQVSGDARVYGNAQVYGNAWVSGDAQVYGDAQVSGNAWVSGNAQVYGNAQVSGNAQVYGNAWVSGNAWVGLTPINIIGVDYNITIYSGFAQVGCKLFLISEWREKTQEEIKDMDGDKALTFYPKLIAIFDALGL